MTELDSCKKQPSSAADPLVLVAGAARTGKSTLVHSITGKVATSQQKISNWNIINKYYSANVVFCETVGEKVSNGSHPEALVLVFSLTDSGSFSHVQHVAKSFNLEAIEVKLLCGTHADALLEVDAAPERLETSLQKALYQEAASWSIEHRFEFIACCPGVPATDAVLALEGVQQGVRRVVEALQSHTWSNLTLAERQRHQPDAVMASGFPAVSSSGAGKGAPEPTAAAESGKKQGPITPTSVCDQWEEQQREVDNADTVDAEVEHTVEGLERLIEDLQGHKARLASLPDDERRKQAGAIALHMLEMLGLHDEESSGEEGG
ncbi:hypothetical protein Agub_g4119 [Astrephomene gubernaculifera]|uniref:Uncharacterized protein n=1 Tax=Astrephomene gubernaculifera TaxID=47775 RepID=A0AAD3HJI1_9CHLO|nr:hypothetical protein Agub_g4119 [Astrephomene gubernaculifera]